MTVFGKYEGVNDNNIMVCSKNKTDMKLSTYHGGGGHKSCPPPAEALIATGRGESVLLKVITSGTSTTLSGKPHIQEDMGCTN